MSPTAVQAAKELVWSLWREPAAGRGMLPDASGFDRETAFHGPQPVGDLRGRTALFEQFYCPLAEAFESVRRDAYLFLGGTFEGHTWVASAGDFVGIMARHWLGIPPGSREQRRLRFGEFYRVEHGRVVEVRCLLDIPGLAAQAGYPLLPPFAGRAEVPPGPAAGNGVCTGPQPQAQTRETLALVEAMLGGCNRLRGSDLRSMGMAAYWHEDMVWHGPWGIGSCYGFREFQDFAQGPSVASFPDRRGGFHVARFAEGVTAAFTGWPSLRGTFDGAPFRGIAPTGRPIGQNIMDFYVRRGERLHENWVLIDLVDFARQCGVDLLDGLPGPLSACPSAS